jgi:hypothetical protein
MQPAAASSRNQHRRIRGRRGPQGPAGLERPESLTPGRREPSWGSAIPLRPRWRGLLLGAAGAVVVLCVTGPLGAELQPLEFFGLRPGATLAATDEQVRRLGASWAAVQPSHGGPPGPRLQGHDLDPWMAPAPRLAGGGRQPDGHRDRVGRPERRAIRALARRSRRRTVRGGAGCGHPRMMQWIRGRQMIRLTPAGPPRTDRGVGEPGGWAGADGWQFRAPTR